VGDVFGECHTPCTLKTSFVDFDKKRSRRIVTATKDLILQDFFSGSQNHLYIIELVLILDIAEILLAGR
jgi:hypothetical protein